MKLKMYSRFVDQGHSFCQAFESVHTAWEVGFNPSATIVTESTAWKSVQSAISINIKCVRELLTDKSKQEFRNAFDRAANTKNS